MKNKSIGKKILIIILCILLACAIGAGGYAGNMFGYFNNGNKGVYSVKNSEVIDSPLKDKTIIFLGSSVTYGFAAHGESFVDYLEKQDRITAIKEAVSGTTLVDDKSNSYVSRMKAIDTSIKADAFVCQLSTNDATQDKPLGKLSDSKNISDFDTHTIIGAMEYIVAYARDTWNCPVIFYTGTKYDSENYKTMVDALYQVQEKWDIGIIDLWNNKDMNEVAEKDYKVYMNDPIHPTRKGYKEWWTPVIREYLQNNLK